MNKKLRTTTFLLCLLSSICNSQISDSLDTLPMLASELQASHQDSFGYPIFHYFSEHVEGVIVIRSDQDPRAQISTDANKRMQSLFSGLNIFANSYTPAGSSSITFRGMRSFGNSNEPLILLDGLPVDNSEWNNRVSGTDQSNRLMDLDPNFISEVGLKNNMSARARYGIVGANGVLELKTKKGRIGKPVITFSSTLSRSEVSNLPALQNIFAPGRTLDGEQTYRGPEELESFSWGPPISSLSYDGDSDYPYDSNGMLVQNTFGEDPILYNPLDFFTQALSNNQSLQVSGGFKKLYYAVSGSLNNQDGVIPTNNYDRKNLGLNLSFEPTEKLSLQLSGNLSNARAQRNQKGSNLSGIMLGVLRTPVTFDNTNGLDDPLNNQLSYQLPDGLPRSHRPEIIDNPYWSLNKNKHLDVVNRQMLQFSALYSLSDNLEFNLSVGTDAYRDEREGGIDNKGSILGSSAYERSLNFDSQNFLAGAKYHWLNNDQVKLSTSLSYNYNQRQSDYSLIEGLNLLVSDDVSITNAETLESFFFIVDNKRSGFLFATDFRIGDYLFIDGSVRQDYSNKFGEETNGFLSYGLGFDFSLFNWLGRDAEVSDFDLLLSASYGKFGNDFLPGNEIGRYQAAVIDGDNFISSNTELGFDLNPLILANDFTAESTSGYDAGFNVRSLKYGINLGVLYYNEISDGLIMSSPIAGSTGHSNVLNNIGSVSNKGIDLMLNARLLNMNKFKWFLGFNFNKNNNEVLEMDGDIEEIILGGFTAVNSVAKVGHPLGAINGWSFLRNEQGSLIIDDDGFPMFGEKAILGDPNPDWTLFVNNQIQLGKNLGISGLLEIKQGGEMWCGTCGTLDYFGRSQKSADDRGRSIVFEGVTLDGSTNTTEVDLAPTTGHQNDFYYVRYGFGGIGEMSIYDTSWIRLRSLVVSYDFKDLIGFDVIRELKLSLFAENLFLITDYPGIDPETNLTGNAGGRGLDYYNNPGTKTYGLNLRASF